MALGHSHDADKVEISKIKISKLNLKFQINMVYLKFFCTFFFQNSTFFHFIERKK